MSLSRKKLAVIALFILFLFILPLTVFIAQRQSEIRSRADEASAIIITSPQQAATVSGSQVILSINANIPLGHHGVEFYLDDVLIGSDATAPYLITWDST